MNDAHSPHPDPLAGSASEEVVSDHAAESSAPMSTAQPAPATPTVLPSAWEFASREDVEAAAGDEARLGVLIKGKFGLSLRRPLEAFFRVALPFYDAWDDAAMRQLFDTLLNYKGRRAGREFRDEIVRVAREIWEGMHPPLDGMDDLALDTDRDLNATTYSVLEVFAGLDRSLVDPDARFPSVRFYVDSLTGHLMMRRRSDDGSDKDVIICNNTLILLEIINDPSGEESDRQLTVGVVTQLPTGRWTWKKVTAPYTEWMDRTAMRRLGVQTTDAMAGNVVDYLFEQYTLNTALGRNVIPQLLGIKSCGWKQTMDGTKFFVAGLDVHFPPEAADPTAPPALDWDGTPLEEPSECGNPDAVVQAKVIATENEAEVLYHIRQQGLWENWLYGLLHTIYGFSQPSPQSVPGTYDPATLVPIVPNVRYPWDYPQILYPIPAALIFGALASPVVERLRLGSFFVHTYGSTSRGKTTSLQVSASVWGDPLMGHLTMTWDITRVAAERIMAALSGVGMWLDEATTAHRDLLQKIIYSASGGVGRQRGNLRGIDRSAQWGLVVLSSGEHSLTAQIENSGADMRVMGLYGSPFPPNVPFINALNNLYLANYGHAGKRWIQHLMTWSEEDWRRFRAQIEGEVAQWMQMPEIASLPDELRAMANRMATHHVLLGLVGDRFNQIAKTFDVVARVIDDKWAFKSERDNPRLQTLAVDAMQKLWLERVLRIEGANYAEKSAKWVLSWAHGQITQFYGQYNEERPPNHIVGTWQPASTFLGILPSDLERALGPKFPMQSVLEAWHERGWIKTDRPGAMDYPMSMPGGRVRILVLFLTKLPLSVRAGGEG